MSRASPSTVTARENPFASHRVESIPFRFPEGDWSQQLDFLRRLNWRGAIVGNHGSGKTTLLLELKSRLLDSLVDDALLHYCFVPRRVEEHDGILAHLLQSASAGCQLLVDGIERLNWWQRRKLLGHGSGNTRLVVTAHRPIGLPIWVHCRTDWNLMHSVLNSLIEKPDDSLLQDSKKLFHAHRGNIRDVLRDLYDR